MASYNPLTAAMPSRKTIIARARRRAHRDTLAKIAALPSEEALRGANKSVLDSIGHNLQDFRGLAAGMGGSYAAAARPADVANSSTAAGVGAVGAAPPPDTRGGLLGAMAGSTYGSLLGQQQAASAGLSGTLTALQGKRAAVGAGEQALYEQYLQAGYDDALKLAAARSNASLASMGAGIDQQNADAHMLSAQASASRADTAARKLQQDLSGTSDPALKAALKKAYDDMQKMLTGKGTHKATIAGNYHFKVTDPNTGQVVPFDTRAKTGDEARKIAQQHYAGLLTNSGLKWDNSFFTGMDPIQADVPNSGASRTQALQQAASYLETVGGLSHEAALAYARRWLPPRPKKKKRAKQHNRGQGT